MIQLLFAVTLTQMFITLLILVKTPLSNLVLSGLDRLKRGIGPVMVETIACILIIVLISTLYNIIQLQNLALYQGGTLSTADQVLFVQHVTQSTLIGAILFLTLMIDRLHYYLRELNVRRNNMEAAEKQSEDLKDSKDVASDEVKDLKEEMVKLEDKLEQLESDLEAKTKEVNAAEANAVALRKQSDGSPSEYEHVLAENENLRNQLKSLDQELPHSDCKKDT